MRIDSSSIDLQSLIELRPREALGLRFTLKGLGCSRTALSRQASPVAQLKGNIPSMRHLSLYPIIRCCKERTLHAWPYLSCLGKLRTKRSTCYAKAASPEKVCDPETFLKDSAVGT